MFKLIIILNNIKEIIAIIILPANKNIIFLTNKGLWSSFIIKSPFVFLPFISNVFFEFFTLVDFHIVTDVAFSDDEVIKIFIFSKSFST